MRGECRPWFEPDESWRRWVVFLAALFGLPLDDRLSRNIYREHTGRSVWPDQASREAYVVVGRRGGKSLIAAFTAVFLACFRRYDQYLKPGEVGTIALIAADRKEARTVMRYILGFLELPRLKAQVVNQTKETIEFQNRVVIEMHTASFRAVRGYSLVAAICDEIAFWRTDESANPDSEIIAALRPGMATIPGALLLAISSPYARRGVLWEAYDRHFGRDSDPVLVWKGPTTQMNPSLDPRVIAEAYEDDEVAAQAEYGAEFRRDVEGFVSKEVVDAVIRVGRYELAPEPEMEYRAFVDPSGGMQDSFTMAIGHFWGGNMILDCIREIRPPFNPKEAVNELAQALNIYGVTKVTGDHYAGEWPRERFREHGIVYWPAPKAKSQYYIEFLPRLNSGGVELLDHKRLRAQILGLERRVGRSGRDTIDHAPGGHDDIANAVAGLVGLFEGAHWRVLEDEVSVHSPLPQSPLSRLPAAEAKQLEQGMPQLKQISEDMGHCAGCQHREERSGAPAGRTWCARRLFWIRDMDVACEEFDAKV